MKTNGWVHENPKDLDNLYDFSPGWAIEISLLFFFLFFVHRTVDLALEQLNFSESVQGKSGFSSIIRETTDKQPYKHINRANWLSGMFSPNWHRKLFA